MRRSLDHFTQWLESARRLPHLFWLVTRRHLLSARRKARTGLPAIAVALVLLIAVVGSGFLVYWLIRNLQWYWLVALAALAAILVFWLRRCLLMQFMLLGSPKYVALETLKMAYSRPTFWFLSSLRSAELRRIPHLEVSRPLPLSPGQSFNVHVFADIFSWRDGESGEPVTLDVRPWQRRFALDVWLVANARHFKIRGTDRRRLIIRRDRHRSTTVTFRLTVLKKPESQVGQMSALFAHQGRACGRVCRNIEITLLPRAAEEPTTPAPEPVGSHDPPASIQIDRGRSADLNVRIAALSGDGRSFRCHVQTNLLWRFRRGRSEDWILPHIAHSWILAKMEDFTRAGVDPSLRTLALRAAGLTLFEAAPQLFRRVFWKLLEQGKPLRSISIVSDEPYMPWELMIPSRRTANGKEEQRDPLGVEFLLGRWTSRKHVHAPQSLPLHDCYVLAPKDSKLPHAQEEAEMVLRLFDGERIDPARIKQIQSFLGRRARSLLHVVCHGKSVNGEQVFWLEEREQLRAYLLSAMGEVRTALGASRPLVFLNACEAGRKEPALVGAGGFAEAFMALDAGSVVAPLWAVKDNIAHQVAKEFYARLQSNPRTPVAGILREIRRRAYLEGGGEDTWAAYCFYGDPLATAVCFPPILSLRPDTKPED